MTYKSDNSRDTWRYQTLENNINRAVAEGNRREIETKARKASAAAENLRAQEMTGIQSEMQALRGELIQLKLMLEKISKEFSLSAVGASEAKVNATISPSIFFPG